MNINTELAIECQREAAHAFEKVQMNLRMAEASDTPEEREQWEQFAACAQHDAKNATSSAIWLLTVKGA